MKKKRRVTRRKYILGFAVVVLVLALVRLVFPSVNNGRYSDIATPDFDEPEEAVDSAEIAKRADVLVTVGDSLRFYNADGARVKNRVKGVWSYKDCFPDTNAVHLAVAKRYGVIPVENEEDAERRKGELVYINASPFYSIAKLSSSIPYLVPRAALLLHDISRNFMDSLAVKGVRMNKLVVTSVLRSRDDVEALRKHNRNASPNSCHVYGTTFDISYTRFVPLQRPVMGDTLKRVLSEVLDDMRRNNRCYVKYELHQSCYHVTVR